MFRASAEYRLYVRARGVEGSVPRTRKTERMWEEILESCITKKRYESAPLPANALARCG